MTLVSRQAFPDQLRGLALLGIIVVNAPFSAISTAGYTAASIASPLSVIFCAWGLGFFGSMGAAAVLGIAVLCWVGLETGMHVWLTRFAQGPLEWLMGRWTRRSVTLRA
jgi:uncharacterized membrane protein YeiB